MLRNRIWPWPIAAKKVIVSTNIAETSLTVEGVEAVIDTGKAKKASYDQTRKVGVLLSSPISQSSAEQRAGRAGRTAPGYCLRMWTLAEHERRDFFELPEIQRMDLSDLYLKLRAVDICPKALDWFETHHPNRPWRPGRPWSKSVRYKKKTIALPLSGPRFPALVCTRD